VRMVGKPEVIGLLPYLLCPIIMVERIMSELS
jgi:hypothetical protein